MSVEMRQRDNVKDLIWYCGVRLNKQSPPPPHTDENGVGHAGRLGQVSVSQATPILRKVESRLETLESLRHCLDAPREGGKENIDI